VARDSVDGLKFAADQEAFLVVHSNSVNCGRKNFGSEIWIDYAGGEKADPAF
jgi:hypothetical protein